MALVPQAGNVGLQHGTKRRFCGCQAIETLRISPAALLGRLNLAEGAPPCTHQATEYHISMLDAAVNLFN